LIVPSKPAGACRLAAPNLATVVFDPTGVASSVLLNHAGGTLALQSAIPATLQLTPGELMYEFLPRQIEVGWLVLKDQSFSPAGIRRVVSVTAGNTLKLDTTPTLRDAIVPRSDLPAGLGLHEGVPYYFRWHATSGSADRDDDTSAIELTAPQAACVGRLLQGLVDGAPEVSTADLLSVAAAAGFRAASHPAGAELPTPFEQLFPHPVPNAWSHLLQPGEQPDTWRLHVPAKP